MLTGTTTLLDDVTPVKVADGAVLGEYTAVLQVSDPVVIGGDDVSPSNGILLTSGASNADRFLTLQIQGDDLYAIAVSGSALIGVLAYSS